MKGLATLRELASGGRAQRATPGRKAMGKGSPGDYVDEQIAGLLESIEADARSRLMPERDAAAVAESSPWTLSTRRIPWEWREIRSVLTYVLLAAAFGVLIGLLVGR